MKIFIPKNEQIKERILNEVEKSRGNDICVKKLIINFIENYQLKSLMQWIFIQKNI